MIGGRRAVSRFGVVAWCVVAVLGVGCGGAATDDDVRQAVAAIGDEPAFGASPVTPVDLAISMSATDVALLDPVVVALDLWVEDGTATEPFEPAVPDGFVGSVVRAPDARPWAGGTWTRWTLTLRPTAVGEAEVPSFVARVAAPSDAAPDALQPAASTKAVTLTVTSLLAAAGTGDVEQADAVEDPAPPFEARLDWWLWGGLGAGLVALLVALWAWRRWRAAHGPLPPDAIPLPAHVKALRELARWRNVSRETPDEVDAFYVGVSSVLRTYLEDRFGLHAPERTTEEFLPELERSGRLDAEQRARLRGFLEQSDLVKFARLLPGDDAHVRALEFAERLVESTREDGADSDEAAATAASTPEEAVAAR